MLPKCGQRALSTSMWHSAESKKNAVNVAVNRHHSTTNLTSHRALVYLGTIQGEWEGLVSFW